MPGVRVVNGYVPSGGRLFRLGILPAWVWANGIVREVERGGYDIVHCAGNSPTMLPVLKAARQSGAATIYTETSNGKGPYWKGFASCAPLLDGLHSTASVLVARTARAMGFTGQTFIFPGTSFRKLALLPPPARRRSLGFLGKLETFKAADRVVNVFILAAQRDPGLECHLFGRGSLKGRLEEAVARAGLAGRILFHGYEPDLGQIFSRFAVLVVLADEGQCLAVSEALGSGRECLLLGRHSFRELYGGTEAVRFLDPEADNAALARAMIAALDDPATGTGPRMEAAAEFWRSRFAPEVCLGTLLDCYAKLIAPRGAIAGGRA
jgi:glycosyltransferase involved in cell wall biosynthesis